MDLLNQKLRSEHASKSRKVHELRNTMIRQVGQPARALRVFAIIAAGLASWTASAGPSLTEVSVQPSDASLTIELKLDGAAPETSVFALESPPRISIDIPDTAVALKNRRMQINQGLVQSLTAVQASGRSRVVLNLQKLPEYSVSSSGNSILVVLEGSLHKPAPVPVGSKGTDKKAGEPKRISIVNLDFRRTETGAGRLLLELDRDSVDVDVHSEGGKIVALFRNTAISEDKLSRIDVLDFATPFKFIDTMIEGINTKVSITPVSGAEFEQVAYQLDKTFAIELQPLTERELAEISRQQPEFTGERLNLNFQNIEIRALLQIIADVAGKNLVTSDSVTGDMTLRLENVPWDQALDIVMRTKGLSKAESGNVLWIAPTQEVAAQQAKEIEALEQAEKLAPIVSEIIQINYAKASDLAEMLDSNDVNDDNSFLSKRGKVTVDERTNVLIVQDTREKLEEVQALIARLDVPVRQVLIESRIVVANVDFSRSIGASVGVTTAQTSGSTLIGTSGTLAGANAVTSTLSPSALLTNRLASAFPASSAGPRVPSYGVSILGADFLIDLELSALQAEGKGEVVSNPRVITADGREALIEQGEEIPFTAGGSGAATAQTQFKEAVLALKVTPQITPDNRVIMDLVVSKDSRGDVVPQATGGSAVAIDTSSLDTQVLVNNAETVVLGGIYEQERKESVSKVPLLGDIPLLGYLFRSKTVDHNKRELLIFVTPKILSEGLSAN